MSNAENQTKNVQTPSPAPGPAGAERCTGSSQTCHYQNDINMSACLHSSSNGNNSAIPFGYL